MLEMKVNNIFKIAGKTIFAGELNTDLNFINSIQVKLLLNGVFIKKITINGEVHNKTHHRDLWTKDDIDISMDDVVNGSLVLISI